MHKRTHSDTNGQGAGRAAACLAQSLELSVTNPRIEFTDAQSGRTVKLPTELNERTVLINLDGVTSINSWGMALFIEAMQRIAAQGGNLVLFGIREEVRRVFETARLDRVFHLYSTREEALADQGRAYPGN